MIVCIVSMSRENENMIHEKAFKQCLHQLIFTVIIMNSSQKPLWKRFAKYQWVPELSLIQSQVPLCYCLNLSYFQMSGYTERWLKYSLMVDINVICVVIIFQLKVSTNFHKIPLLLFSWLINGRKLGEVKADVYKFEVQSQSLKFLYPVRKT